MDQSLIELDDNDIYAVFIGSGDYVPTYKRTLFAGKRPHDQLITYLNAADVFVLPTLHEWCCNAIVEALACGLPVISSNRDFNRDILNDNNSILIDPSSISDIKLAILELKTNAEKCTQMRNYALESSKCRTIEHRAKSIIDFISRRIDNISFSI